MIHFDSALESLLTAVRAQLGVRRLKITIIRDVSGQLTAVLDDDSLSRDESIVLGKKLDDVLGAFSPGPLRVLLRKSDLLAEDDVFSSPDRVRIPEFEDTWIIDRLLTNQEWLRQPNSVRPSRPIGVAFSLKGGVGRSTAFAVLAWHLARQGKRVIVVDLDLEAPGIGSLLLDELPDFGAVDWLVEAMVGQGDQQFLQDCLSRSPVAHDSSGVIQVMPAFGKRTRDYVAKVGRAFFTGSPTSDADPGLSVRLTVLTDLFAKQEEPPDIILLDARSGLQDVGAAAVTQIGAEVFVFARDEPQSWNTYRLLFQHLAISKAVTYGMPDEDLRWRLKMVAAQIDKTDSALEQWVEASYETWATLYDDESKSSNDAHDPQVFARDDSNAPHYPLTVYFDNSIRGVGLADREIRPRWDVLEAAFGEFLTAATNRLLANQPPAEPTAR